MGFLHPDRLEEIAGVVLQRVGYTEKIRDLFLASILNGYTTKLSMYPIQYMQIKSDLNDLNETPRLVDGTIPFQIWLKNAGNFLKPFPENKVIQQAIEDITNETVKAEPVSNPTPPDKATIEKIVQEKIILRDDMVSYNFLEAGYKAGISVGLVQVARYDNGQPKLLPGNQPALYLGTGWLLSKDLVITNHHVINAREPGEADATVADFKLQGDNAAIKFDFNSSQAAGVTSNAAKLEASDKALDFAIFRLSAAVDRNPMRLLPETVVVNKDKPQVVNIIQHPQGSAKRVAFRNNHIYEATFPKLTYFTDTDGGTSGSAVFDDNWVVIGLHRASKLVPEIEYNGETTSWINEGVQIKAIVDYLRANNAALAAELTVV